jgi:hypothetical protein
VSSNGTELIDVVLVNLPVEDFRRSQQHHDALLREFALVSVGADTGDDTVPRRLLALVRELSAKFGGFSEEPETRLRDAVENKVANIDLQFWVPAAAKDAAIALGRLLDEADDFCRRGELLTLQAPADVHAFRVRYLEEFIRQIDGEAPRPWPQA